MKKTFFSLAVLIATAFSTNANAQSSVTAKSYATVVGTISIVKAVDMYFGVLSSTASAGTVTLGNSSDIPTPTGGVGLVTATNAKRGTFTVDGTDTATYAVSLPGSITIIDGVYTMTVNALTFKSAGSGNTTNGKLIGGTDTLYVGGTLNVGANQHSGTYTGTYAVTVNYN